MLRKFLLIGTLAAVLTGCNSLSSDSALSSAHSPLPVRSQLQHFTLENGLQIFLLPRTQPGVELRLLVNSGSLQENDQQRGLAHFTEHMAFKGTTHFPGTSGFKQLEQQGFKLGSHVNAVTSLNATLYQLSLPEASAKQVTIGLQVMADWASHLSFDRPAFEQERQVIVEEWRLRQGIGSRINDSLEQLRYNGSRYAERNPIGDLNIVREAPMEQAIAYYKAWYQPQRMVLVAIGNFDEARVREEINQLFTAPTPSVPSVDDPQWQEYSDSRQLLIAPIFDKEQGQRFIQFALQKNIAAPLNTRQGQYQDLLDSLWLAILNQRFAILVDNDLLPAISINDQGSMLDNRRLQLLSIAHPKGDDYLAATQILFTELQRMATEPVNQQELDQARQKLLAKLSQQAATEQRYPNDYLANQLTTAIQYDMPTWNKRQQLDTTYQLIKNTQPADLQRHIAELLNVASPRLALIGPDSDEAKIKQQQFHQQWQRVRLQKPGPFTQQARSVALTLTPPEKGSIVSRSKLANDNAEIWQLSNGAKVIVKADKKLKDDIHFKLQLPGGRSLEEHQSAGAVDWALNMPESSGYGSYSPRELALLAKNSQVTVRPFSELLDHGFRGKAPVDQLDSAFKLLHLKLTQPQFSGEKLELQKQHFALSQSRVPVERTFLDHINRQSYQHGELMVIDPNGAWQHFSAQQLQQINRQLLTSTADMTLVISGALDSRQLAALVEQWIASLPASNGQLAWRDRGIKPKMAHMAHSYPISSSDKSMVSIQFSAETPWTQRDSLALQLLDTIVSQRLREELREKASGIYALGFNQMLAKKPSPYYLARLNFTTSPARANEMTQMTLGTIEQIRTHGVSAKALREAKNIWLTENAGSEDQAGYWNEALAQIAGDDGQFQRLSQEKEMMNQITLAEINQLAGRLLGQNQKIFTMTP